MFAYCINLQEVTLPATIKKIGLFSFAGCVLLSKINLDNIEEIANYDLKNGGDGQIEFVSDVSSYDFVLLIDLLTNHKSALDLPNYITSDCYNINQLIADKLFDNSDLGDAFDITREEYLSERDKEEFILNKILGDAKHNALWDAYVISKIGERYDL